MLAERTLELMMSDEMTGERSRQRLLHMMSQTFNAHRRGTARGYSYSSDAWDARGELSAAMVWDAAGSWPS